jgi:hypothetical protein
MASRQGPDRSAALLLRSLRLERSSFAGLVCEVVADDRVQIERLGHLSIDRSQDTEELLLPLKGLALGENFASSLIQSWKQGGYHRK